MPNGAGHRARFIRKQTRSAAEALAADACRALAAWPAWTFYADCISCVIGQDGKVRVVHLGPDPDERVRQTEAAVKLRLTGK